MNDHLVDVKGLCIDAPVGRLVDDVSFHIDSGEALGVVGESGSGKSLTARALIALTADGLRVSGSVRVAGHDVPGLRGRALRQFRGRSVGMIFQDPRAHINPVRSIGDFLVEPLVLERRQRPDAARRRVLAILDEVGVSDGARRLRQYPHELSGGLLQRVMIASVLAAEPALILADEPTTALDVTSQADVMAILTEQRRERGLALLFITHDLELAAATCDRTAVMYAGRLVETADSTGLQERPGHPYTSGLMVSRPSIDLRATRLPVVPGRPVAAFEAGPGCAFAPRCPHAQTACERERPEARESGGTMVACHRAAELAGSLPTTIEEVSVHG
ncbi:ABC transporter ATP-binding protein [Specibacter cremeus]|uniref:ABC transporter ATP-binding protein n=1 Tax=Specibacter cremeus TaxID=1629051 RepID=UPI000F768631|nr:ABC transporter ATP-binding protein [Specibacter cremeus]